MGYYEKLLYAIMANILITFAEILVFVQRVFLVLQKCCHKIIKKLGFSIRKFTEIAELYLKFSRGIDNA